MDNQVSGRQGKSEQIDHKLYKYNRQKDQAGAVSKRCGLGIRQQGVVTKEQKLHLQKWFLKCGPQIRTISNAWKLARNANFFKKKKKLWGRSLGKTVLRSPSDGSDVH